MKATMMTVLLGLIMMADAGALDFDDWRGQVKEKKVVQPETDVSPEWKFTPHPFPPIEQVVSQKPDPLPVYGVYHWGREYKQFRKEIKEVGWKSYRMGGFIDEEALAMAMEDGMEILMTLQIGRTLEELKTTGKRNAFQSDEEFIQKFLEDLEDFCSKYGPGGSFFAKRPDLAKNPVRYVEIWNEPNFSYMISNHADMKAVKVERDKLYAKLLKESGAFIKSKFPEIQVVGFAAGGASFDDKRFVANVYAVEPSIGKSYDIFSTHPYTSTPPMADRVKKWGSFSIAGGLNVLREIMEKNGDAGKTVWYTEVGWKIRQSDGGMFPDAGKHTGDFPQPAMVQAANVTKMYLLAMRLGVRRVHIMSVADADQFNSGFFDRKGGEWRPAAYATQQLIRTMPNPKILAAISEAPGEMYAYQFKSDWNKPDSKEVIVAWQEQKQGVLKVPLPAGKKVSKVFNMLGGEEPFEIKDGAVQFAGGPLPSYLVLE